MECLERLGILQTLFFRLTASVEELEKAVKGGNSTQIEESQRKFVQDCKDPLADWLDKKLGSTVRENSIFTALPRYWEEQFHKDMDALNVSFIVLIIPM